MKFIVKQLIKIARELIDKDTQFFKSLIKYKVVNKKQIYKDNEGKFYQFDELHGHWQVYNRNGRHIFIFDQNGNYLEESIKGRKINLK